MNDNVIQVYLPPDANIDAYPTFLDGDMNLFETLDYETQWYHYLLLRDAGLNMEICRSIPESGVLLLHRRFVPSFIWYPRLYIIVIQWDYPRSDRAQMHIVSNKYKTTLDSLALVDRMLLPGQRCCLPPQMHFDLIPRNAVRGGQFENIVYMGGPQNLDSEIRSAEFRARLAREGLNLNLVYDASKMADYSYADAVLAVREFGALINHKPPEKLINAWRAGVPAVLGTEIGFQELRRTSEDYTEVDSLEEVFDALMRLKQDPDLRQRMTLNGLARAEEYSLDNLKQMWAEFFEQTAFPAYEGWCRLPWIVRMGWLSVRYVLHLLRRVKCAIAG